MRIIICDDLKEAVIDLREKIKNILPESEIEEYTCLNELAKSVRKMKRPDVVFMDINWENGNPNGIDFSDKILDVPVVFVTAYPLEYAEKIFDKKLQPAGFLIKPVKKEQLAVLLEKIIVLKKGKATRMVLFSRGKKLVIPFNDIMYLENQLHKTYVHINGKEELLISKSLSTLKEHLNEEFIECHKSYMVNPSYVVEISSNRIKLKNGDEIPVSRAKSVEAKKLFFDYIQKKSQG